MKTLRTAVPILAALIWLSPARADDLAKTNFMTVLRDHSGTPFTFSECPGSAPRCKPDELVSKEMTLSWLALNALVIQEQNESGDEQVRRAVLGQEIFKKGESALTAKDRDLLCEAIAKFVNKAQLSALVTLRAWEIIDPARVKK